MITALKPGAWIESIKTGRRGQLMRIKKDTGHYCISRGKDVVDKKEPLIYLRKIPDPKIVKWSLTPLWHDWLSRIESTEGWVFDNSEIDCKDLAWNIEVAPEKSEEGWIFNAN